MLVNVQLEMPLKISDVYGTLDILSGITHELYRIALLAGNVSYGNDWERRSHTYFGRRNAVPTVILRVTC